MQINRKLMPIKVHYFLRYAGSAFLTMVLPLIMRQKGVSSQGIGFLWSVMPFVGLITNSISGALADYFRAHRAVFLLSLIFLTSSLVTCYILPDVPINGNNVSIVQTSSSVRLQIPDQLNSNLTLALGNSSLIHNFSGDLSTLNISILHRSNFSGSLLNYNESHTLSSTGKLLQNGIDPEMITDGGQPFRPDPEMLTGKTSISSGDSSSLSYLLGFPQFWLIFFTIMIEQMGLSTCVMISDAVCFQILGNERQKYGPQRLWGTIGMGSFSILTGYLVDLYSRGLPQTDYLPAVIICIVVMIADIILVSKIRIPHSKESKLKMGDVGNVLIHPQTILLFITVFVMGTSLGLLWVFKLMHIEDVANVWNPNFTNLKLLQGLDLGIETFGGEIPFFFLSGLIIERLGHNVVLACCIGTMSIRCCLYYSISNPWCFLPVELLNGISFALFHSCMASYASRLAPPGAQATLQALVRAFLSIGLATAGFLGGFLYQSMGGAAMYLSVGIFDAGFCIFFIISQILVNKYCSHQELQGTSGYDKPRSTSSQDKISSVECQKYGYDEDSKDKQMALMNEGA